MSKNKEILLSGNPHNTVQCYAKKNPGLVKRTIWDIINGFGVPNKNQRHKGWYFELKKIQDFVF